MTAIFYTFVGIQVLMEMLSEKSPFGNSPERAACEQVQQKASVTLARLSRDPEVANSAIKLNCTYLYDLIHQRDII